MKTLHKLKIFLISLIAGVIVFPFSVAQSSTPENAKPQGDNKGSPVYLFIQTSKIAEIHYNSTDKTYSLTLYDSDPWVIYFSNAPDKTTNFTSTEKFIIDFKKDLDEHHQEGLNAGLIALEENTEKLVRYTFTLTEPKYDKSSHQTSYTAHLIPGPQVTPLPGSSKFHHVALFIDGCASCGGSGF